jgi:hypothetical protein
MPVYFTSDHHFGHAAARSFYRRPFASIDEMHRRRSIVGTPWSELEMSIGTWATFLFANAQSVLLLC